MDKHKFTNKANKNTVSRIANIYFWVQSLAKNFLVCIRALADFAKKITTYLPITKAYER